MLGFSSVFLISVVRMDSSNVFASLLPLNVDHTIVQFVILNWSHDSMCKQNNYNLLNGSSNDLNWVATGMQTSSLMCLFIVFAA